MAPIVSRIAQSFGLNSNPTKRRGRGVKFSATGGNLVYNYNGKRIHRFTSPGSFIVSGSSGSVEYVVVGGGGAAGSGISGGGGAGGYLTGTITITVGTHLIQVGDGGVGRSIPGTPGFGNNGQPSTIGSLVEAAGGGGGGYYGNSGLPGGSGGGGGTAVVVYPGPGTTAFSGGSGTPGQGNPGGSGFAGNGAGGGGGGAGGSGGNAGIPAAGAGGNGIRVPTTFQDPSNVFGTPGPAGSNFYVAGGGAGGTLQGSATGSIPGNSGGFGGGGPTSAPTVLTGNPGTVNTGGGGGGTNGPSSGGTFTGGSGGSGIVLIAYSLT